MKRLRASKHRRQRFDRGSDNVVVRVLFGKADAARLAMGSEALGFVLLGTQLGHDLVPERSRGAQLRNFHKEVHADAEEETEARREIVDVESIGLRSADIF